MQVVIFTPRKYIKVRHCLLAIGCYVILHILSNLFVNSCVSNVNYVVIL